MKQDLTKRFLSSALALSLCVSMLPTAFADDLDTDSDTVDTSSSSQSTYATLTAEALMFNLTVPTTMPRASPFLSVLIVQVELPLARISMLKTTA